MPKNKIDPKIILALEREVGKSIEKATIFCPMCSDGEQKMATIGDQEERLFCPHCDFEIEIKVQKGRHLEHYIYDWYKIYVKK